MTEGRALIEQLFAIIDGHRYDDYLTVVHPDVEFVPPQGRLDAAGWVEFSQGFAAGFPDGTHTITRVIQLGGEVAVEGTWDATNIGPMATPQGVLPPTGARVHLPFAGLATIRGDKFASVRVYFDQVVMLTQLGLLPEPATA